MRGDRLRSLREKWKLSQLELANAVGSSEPQIWRYEHNDANPRADILKRLAEYFAVSADYLLGITDDESGYVDSGLTALEKTAIEHWRRGERMEAIRVIAGDEQ